MTEQKPRRSYTWSVGFSAPTSIVEPIKRVEGSWKEAWAERLRRGTTWPHDSRFVPADERAER